MDKPQYKVFKGPLLNPCSDTECDFWLDGALVLNKCEKSDNYTVCYVGSWYDMDHVSINQQSVEVFENRDFLVMPSFIDLHFHWVQDAVRQKPKKALLSWLREYTWPHEAKFQSEEYSKNAAIEFSRYLVKTGTLAGAVYGSPHSHTVNHVHDYFVGDFIAGNVLMTMNSTRDLQQSIQNAYIQLQQLAEKFTTRYAVTPRIAAVTDPQLMQQGARIAKKTDSFIQTHLSETKEEISWTLDIYRKITGFEDIKTYTAIYDRCELLQNKTILGHCIYLSSEEWELIRDRGAMIAHCPTSNAPVADGGLGSGLFDFELAEKYGIPWGLGSDIGGGPWLSMFDVMYSFVEQNQGYGRQDATYTKALYRSTLASAKILRMDEVSGNFFPGKWANFIAVPFASEKKGSYTNAESVLQDLITPLSSERCRFDDLVNQVFYKGHSVFKR